MIQFIKATRKALKGRIALDGPSGAGKTFTALRFAFAMGKRVCVIASESGAVEKYVGENPDGTPWDFDVCFLTDYSPASYTDAILAAGKAGYEVIVIDSLSHAWNGEGGALELVDKKGGNSFTAWKDVTPMHNRMIEAIVRSPAHVIATMRSKTEYVMETGPNGKQIPRKIGMAPVQRAGMEYEFDLYCSLDWSHICNVSKSRCPELDGRIAVKPGADFIAPFIKWLAEGSNVPEGYYSADADDLKKLAAAEQAMKSPEEVKAEAAAKQREALLKQREGLAGGKGVEKPAESAPVEAPKVEAPKVEAPAAESKPVEAPARAPAEIRKDTPITAETKAEINRLLDALGTTDAELLRMIKSYDLKAAKLSQLKEFDALEIKSVLHGQWLSREPKNADTAAPVKEKTGELLPIESPSSPQASLNTTPNSTTPAQKKRLIELRTQLPGAVWPLEEQKAFLAKHNAAGFVTLSEAVAAELLADLEARAAKLSAA